MEKPTTQLGTRRETVIPKKVLIRAPEDINYFDGTARSPISDEYCAFREAATFAPEVYAPTCCDVRDVYNAETGVCVDGMVCEDDDLARENNPWILPSDEDRVFGTPVAIDILAEMIERGQLYLHAKR